MKARPYPTFEEKRELLWRKENCKKHENISNSPEDRQVDGFLDNIK